MKRQDPSLPLRLAEAQQELSVTQIALRCALNNQLIHFHSVHSARETFFFYLLDPEAPHGGVLLIKQTIAQENGVPLVNIVVQYADDFQSQFLQRERQRTVNEWQILCRDVQRKMRQEVERYRRAA